MHELARKIIKHIIQEKQREISTTETARKMAMNDAHEAEGAMISRYDTFLEEAQYLAEGQSKRLLEARQVVEMLERALEKEVLLHAEYSVRVGDIYVVENMVTGEKRNYVLVVEGAGGSSYSSDELRTTTFATSMKTPVGQFLVFGEDYDLLFPGDTGTWEVIDML